MIPSKFAKVPNYPTRGGATALFLNHSKNIEEVPYGTIYENVQEVVDFIMGYAKYLDTAGFTFDYYNKDTGQIEDWRFSAKEFMFWTTQNWAAGTIIALSPSANQIKFFREYAIVDNLYDNFYDYPNAN